MSVFKWFSLKFLHFHTPGPTVVVPVVRLFSKQTEFNKSTTSPTLLSDPLCGQSSPSPSQYLLTQGYHRRDGVVRGILRIMSPDKQQLEEVQRRRGHRDDVHHQVGHQQLLATLQTHKTETEIIQDAPLG